MCWAGTSTRLLRALTCTSLARRSSLRDVLTSPLLLFADASLPGWFTTGVAYTN